MEFNQLKFFSKFKLRLILPIHDESFLIILLLLSITYIDNQLYYYYYYFFF